MPLPFHQWFPNVTTPLAALVAGIVASLHCAGMCAPLSCALFRTCSGRKLIAYHLPRACSYTALGALLGSMGGAAASLFSSRPSQIVPVALVVLFLAMAFGFDRNLPQPAFLRRLIALLHVSLGDAGGRRDARHRHPAHSVRAALPHARRQPHHRLVGSRRGGDVLLRARHHAHLFARPMAMVSP